MKYNVSPTRMERLRQREKLQTVQHAHQLLKDKADEMLRTFHQLMRQNKTLRTKLEQDLTRLLRTLVMTGAKMSAAANQAALQIPRQAVQLTCTTQNIMGLIIPQVEIVTTPVTPVAMITTPLTFDQALNELQALTPMLLTLANVEKTCTMLAAELQKIRRRINSLTYNMIPNIQETIQYITMKLDEHQRENQIRAMKIKEQQTKSS